MCFGPAVSAVSIRDLDRQEDLYVNVDALAPEQSDLDDFHLSGNNDKHAAMTPEIGDWVLDRLPD
ncbi:hypothetical protein [Streptomyces sp. NPDC091215]|uniref:hypothetical protein n=1 Tax=Streptomyces sp. NPDC091215 TaxID=3155192 RepID=UPI00341EF879